MSDAVMMRQRLVGVEEVIAPLGLHCAIEMLEDYERQRALALRHEPSRRAYVAAHVLVREVAAEMLGGKPSDLRLQQRCPECGGAHGPPSIVGHPELKVSLSHCETAVAAVAASRPVAVDVESLHSFRYADLRDARVLTPNERLAVDALPEERRERMALTLWSRKECLVKLGLLALDDFAAESLVPPLIARCAFAQRWDEERQVLGVIATLKTGSGDAAEFLPNDPAWRVDH